MFAKFVGKIPTFYMDLDIMKNLLEVHLLGLYSKTKAFWGKVINMKNIRFCLKFSKIKFLKAREILGRFYGCLFSTELAQKWKFPRFSKIYSANRLLKLFWHRRSQEKSFLLLSPYMVWEILGRFKLKMSKKGSKIAVFLNVAHV